MISPTEMNDAILGRKCYLVDKLVLEGRFISILTDCVYDFMLWTSDAHYTMNVYQALVRPTDEQ